MTNQAEPSARLDALDVVRWDLAPPEQGRIRFLDAAGATVAHGRYRVVLSFGPDLGYRMAHTIDAYSRLGIPVVERDRAGLPDVAPEATHDEAWRRGHAVATAAGADLAYWCANLLVAVDELAEGSDDAPIVGLEQRLGGLIRAVGQPDVTDETLDAAGKSAAYHAAAPLLRAEMAEALVFALEGEDQDVEMYRNHVGVADLPGLISAYWLLQAWQPRTLLVHLVSDQDDPSLQPIWRDILRAPDDGPETARHGAKAVALARLDPDMTRYEEYLFDYALTHREVARRLRRLA